MQPNASGVANPTLDAAGPHVARAASLQAAPGTEQPMNCPAAVHELPVSSSTSNIPSRSGSATTSSSSGAASTSTSNAARSHHQSRNQPPASFSRFRRRNRRGRRRRTFEDEDEDLEVTIHTGSSEVAEVEVDGGLAAMMRTLEAGQPADHHRHQQPELREEAGGHAQDQESGDSDVSNSDLLDFMFF